MQDLYVSKSKPLICL